MNTLKYKIVNETGGLILETRSTKEILEYIENNQNTGFSIIAKDCPENEAKQAYNEYLNRHNGNPIK